MGLFEKRRFRNFLQFAQEVDVNDQKTWKGFNVKTQTMKECYDKHGLDAGTADFTGHALALYLNDEYVCTGPLVNDECV
jgi:Rab GDP dissociation inhibitor